MQSIMPFIEKHSLLSVLNLISLFRLKEDLISLCCNCLYMISGYHTKEKSHNPSKLSHWMKRIVDHINAKDTYFPVLQNSANDIILLPVRVLFFQKLCISYPTGLPIENRYLVNVVRFIWSGLWNAVMRNKNDQRPHPIQDILYMQNSVSLHIWRATCFPPLVQDIWI